MTAPFYVEKIKYLPQNNIGKDFVIGDIHGRYDLVFKALEKVNFNIEKDRLFCVGDLIDRGVHSEYVLEFLSEPYVHAIRGNHEDMLLELYSKGEAPSYELLALYGEKVGLSWWMAVDEYKREEILEKLRLLPMVMEIDTSRGKVGLVHADVPLDMSWDEFKQEINDNNEHVIAEAMWGRTRLSHELEEDVEGIGRVYVGHTVQEKIRKLGNVVAIDTGAVFNEHLTMVSIECMTRVINAVKKPTTDIQIVESEKLCIPFNSSYSSMIYSK